MMKPRLSLAAAAAAAAAIVFVPTPAMAWGKTGHRVVAALADAQLSGLARAHVQEILGFGESLDEAATWPDEMRSAPSPFWQKTATPWHYVTLNGVLYDHAPPEGDALDALKLFSAALKNPAARRTSSSRCASSSTWSAIFTSRFMSANAATRVAMT